MVKYQTKSEEYQIEHAELQDEYDDAVKD